MLALFLKLGGGSLEAVRFGQIVLGTAAVGLLADGAPMARTRAAWIAGGLAAFCGLFTFYEVLILQAALEPFLTALDLYVRTWALGGRGFSPGKRTCPEGPAYTCRVLRLLAGAPPSACTRSTGPTC